jgi:penicillin-binding protein 1C
MIKRIFWLILFGSLIIILVPLPKSNFTLSNTLLASDGSLLSAKVSKDDQWYMPIAGKIPKELQQAVICYEDEYFNYHLGINPVSVIKACFYNLSNIGSKRRGASTIPMQVMRMRNQSKKRSYAVKIYESVAAIKYSLITSKSRIIKDWCEIAPYGGNSIGAHAASIRFFQRPLEKLSWSEYALLAILPNNPARINLQSNRDKLKLKRDKLLQKLTDRGAISKEDLEIYINEDLPQKLIAIPNNASHLLGFLNKKYPNKALFHSTIDIEIQKKLENLLQEEVELLAIEGIQNIAATVIDHTTNKLIAYVGNVNLYNEKKYVDIIQSPRSYGSLLKPLLYAQALNEGTILEKELIPDVPINFQEFNPENFDQKFRGAVEASDIVTQSLNVPAVNLLNKIDMRNFYNLIKKLNINHLNKGIDHYGLSIILGGGETSLWEISRIYKGLAQNYSTTRYPYTPIQILENLKDNSNLVDFRFDNYAMRSTIDGMTDITRPREEKSWSYMGYDHKVAWKTGTSYGHKDAWSAGFNGKYQVTVWVGNEIGEGRKDLTGIVRASPIMFKIFNSLPEKKWFTTPPQISKGFVVTVCSESGKLKGPLCTKVYKKTINHVGHSLNSCAFHQKVKNDSIIFQLPPDQDLYFKIAHLQPILKNENEPTNLCKIIYPRSGLKIYIPKKDLFDNSAPLVFKINGPQNGKVFWFLDDDHICTTTNLFTLAITKNLEPGSHTLRIIDDQGNQDEKTFEILQQNQ